MAQLTHAERELVALGAALGSNCVPCIEYHVPEARKAGLDDQRIEEAVHLADKVRQVPARKVLGAALGLLQGAGNSDAGAGGTCGGESGPDAGREAPAGEANAESPCCA
jgi:AhpD family alkylhydroperoxidase